ncbi:Peroxiredoxin [Pedobacter steynii]|uniref:Peroxiredoxin n=1 Tax=Pedobacter steynii TaxID=430522 RepID=A0A1G9KXW9_9SPHI|nr:redoxin domain-containing protein [Pedobacter steynii]NQX38673.1 redoxin domain-containing protein [Pedobacter steynii]SDL54568.1 Peroxiredoxin [Pedobacter steynii]
MMRKRSLFLLLTGMIGTGVFGQEPTKGQLSVSADLGRIKDSLVKVLIEKTDLGGYSRTTDTVKINGLQFSYQQQLAEPQRMRMVFYWKNKGLTSISFWAKDAVYVLTIGDDLKPLLLSPETTGFTENINHLEKQIQNQEKRSDSLEKIVSYENQTVDAVEKRIWEISDSIAHVIDTALYLKFMGKHLNTPEGLYALCKYAARPSGNQRVKSQTERIELLFNQLAPSVKELPSGRTLFHKIALGKEMAIGKTLKDISLPDTAGKVVKISDFRGGYLLVDFWASWCGPCRTENSGLIKAYLQYKDAGFQIIGVTRDHKFSKSAWLQAIAKDGIGLWPQLSDFDDLAQQSYDIQFIPCNYLIDPQGVIIARDLRGAELETTLMKLFKR